MWKATLQNKQAEIFTGEYIYDLKSGEGFFLKKKGGEPKKYNYRPRKKLRDLTILRLNDNDGYQYQLMGEKEEHNEENVILRNY